MDGNAFASPYERVRALRFGVTEHQPPMTDAKRAAAVAKLDLVSDRQASFLTKLSTLWAKGDARQLWALMVGANSTVHVLFDPETTETLLSFVALGGIDTIARMLADRSFPLVDTTPDLYRVLLRILTEVEIVNPHFAWYLIDAHHEMFRHLLQLLAIPRLREPILSIIEHTVSPVGPAVMLRECPTLMRMLNGCQPCELASAARVLALLIVPSMQPEGKHEREPFPQCLARIRTIESTIESNVRSLLDHPTFVKQLFSLIDVQYYRKPPRSDPSQNLQALLQAWVDQTAAGGGQPGPTVQQFLAGWQGNEGIDDDFLYEDELDEEAGEDEEDDDDDNGGDAAAAAPNLNNMNMNVAQLPVEAFEEAVLDQQQMEPPTSPDIVDCSWFLGSSTNVDALWRQRRLVLGESLVTRDGLNQFVSRQPPIHKSPKVTHNTVFSAQSEIFFVLNSLLCTAYHRRAWAMMADSKLLTRVAETFPMLFVAKNRRPTPSTDAASANADAAVETTGTYEDCDETSSTLSSSVNHHTHEPDTLRKIEMLRLLHEYWDSHDADSCIKAMEVEDSHIRTTLADYVSKHLVSSMEDVCVENLMCFSLEAYLRASWFDQREASQRQLAWILPSLLRRIFPNALSHVEGTNVNTSAAKDRIASMRRLESTFTLLGELCKYNCENWRTVSSLLKGRSQERTLIKALLRTTFETNFFLRSVVLSCYPQLRSHRSSSMTTATMQQMRRAREKTDPHLNDFELSDGYAQATFDTQQVVLSRMYHVRVVGYELSQRRATAEEVFATLESSPAALPRERRPWRWLHSEISAIPSNTSATSKATPEDREWPTEPSAQQGVSAIAELPFLWPALSQAMPALFRNLMGHLDADEVESTDRVCAITTSLVLAMAAYCRQGEDGVNELIASAVALHNAERDAAFAAGTKPCPEALASPAGSVASPNSKPTPNDVDADDEDPTLAAIIGTPVAPAPPHDAASCSACQAPPTTVGKQRHVLGIRDLALNYYRVVCVWTAHYQCQRNYFMTLFFCTQVDVPRWRFIVEVLLRLLPAHFLAN